MNVSQIIHMAWNKTNHVNMVHTNQIMKHVDLRSAKNQANLW